MRIYLKGKGVSDILFKCESCSEHLLVDQQAVGKTTACPHCGNTIAIPKPDGMFPCSNCHRIVRANSSLAGETVACPHCEVDVDVPAIKEAPRTSGKIKGVKDRIEAVDRPTAGDAEVVEMPGPATSTPQCPRCHAEADQAELYCGGCGCPLEALVTPHEVDTNTRRGGSKKRIYGYAVAALLVLMTVIFTLKESGRRTRRLHALESKDLAIVTNELPEAEDEKEPPKPTLPLKHQDKLEQALADRTDQKDRRQQGLIWGACRGDAQSQALLGIDYLRGRGMTEDVEKGCWWLGKAAEQGDKPATIILAERRLTGRGIPQDRDAALLMLRPLIEARNGRAATTLGLCYFFGQGVEEDPIEAIKLFEIARQAGREVDEKVQELLDEAQVFLLTTAFSAFGEYEKGKWADEPDLETVGKAIAHYKLKYPTLKECQTYLWLCEKLRAVPHSELLTAAIDGAWLLFDHDIKMFQDGYHRWSGRWVDDRGLAMLQANLVRRQQEINRYAAREASARGRRQDELQRDWERKLSKYKRGRRSSSSWGTVHRTGSWLSPSEEAAFRSSAYELFGWGGGSSGAGEYGKIIQGY